MEKFRSVVNLIQNKAPSVPVFCFRPHQLARDLEQFHSAFALGRSQTAPTSFALGETGKKKVIEHRVDSNRDGRAIKVFYSVKANDADHIQKGLWDLGVRRFDVASGIEVRNTRNLLTAAELGFLHTVKSKEAIRDAYFSHDCRIFALDSKSEMEKILAATDYASDLSLILRLSNNSENALVPLDKKFGIAHKLAPDLLKDMRGKAQHIGLSFHVGSQAMSPSAYVDAIAETAVIISRSGIDVDILNIGGGFPAQYDGFAEPAPLFEFSQAIMAELERVQLNSLDLWCEPGRALVAQAESLLVRIEHMTDDALFINDGIYGALHDAGDIGWMFPATAYSATGAVINNIPKREWIIYGPSCDSADVLKRPVYLPESVTIGDYIEFGSVGAYGRSFASSFNGFGVYETVEIADNFSIAF